MKRKKPVHKYFLWFAKFSYNNPTNTNEPIVEIMKLLLIKNLKSVKKFKVENE